jgi:hypothetical protein
MARHAGRRSPASPGAGTSIVRLLGVDAATAWRRSTRRLGRLQIARRCVRAIRHRRRRGGGSRVIRVGRDRGSGSSPAHLRSRRFKARRPRGFIRSLPKRTHSAVRDAPDSHGRARAMPASRTASARRPISAYATARSAWLRTSSVSALTRSSESPRTAAPARCLAQHVAERAPCPSASSRATWVWGVSSNHRLGMFGFVASR